jgi:hypothetical protein
MSNKALTNENVSRIINNLKIDAGIDILKQTEI